MGKMWEVTRHLVMKHPGRIGYRAQQKLFLLLNCIFFAAIGFIIWLLLQPFVTERLFWLLGCVGYPAVFAGFFGGIIYLWRKN